MRSRQLCSGLLAETLERIVRWCAAATAEQVGLDHRKGRLEVGWDGDVIAFDPEAQWTVEKSGLLFRNKCSPYQGRRLRGVVRATWLRGWRVFDGGVFEGGKPRGELLLEPRVLKKTA